MIKQRVQESYTRARRINIEHISPCSCDSY